MGYFWRYKYYKVIAMKEVTLHIPDNKFETFIRFIKSIPYVKLNTSTRKPKLTASQQKIANGIVDALNEVELHQQGKIKLQSAKEFLNEL